MHEQVLASGATDVRHGKWAEPSTVWLAVETNPAADNPTDRIWYNADTMAAVPYVRAVLYEARSGTPLVLFDAEGGLAGAAADAARRTFHFLHNFNFTLQRGAGALSIDGLHEQRMLMLGLRQQGYNVGARPDRRRELTVANPHGDLDGYVAHWDHCEECGPEAVRPVWDILEERMVSLLPRACAELAEHLERADVRSRLYCADAARLASARLLVNNVGASDTYHSPSHLDRNDVGWTFAFPVKCPHCDV